MSDESHDDWRDTRDRVLEALRDPGGDVPADVPEVLRMLEDGGFWSYLRTDDLIGALLRAHLWCHQALSHMVHLGATVPKHLPSRLGFRATLGLAASTGFLPSELIAPLEVLNRTRNRVAHELGAEPSSDDEDALFAAFPEEMKWIYEKLENEFPAAFVVALAILAIQVVRCEVTMRMRLEPSRPEEQPE